MGEADVEERGVEPLETVRSMVGQRRKQGNDRLTNHTITMVLVPHNELSNLVHALDSELSTHIQHLANAQQPTVESLAVISLQQLEYAKEDGVVQRLTILAMLQLLQAPSKHLTALETYKIQRMGQ
uniref:Mediator of RNA polymerase II transcription subunit 14 n=1 Tax=Lygus hesperus TaxID=30085 RepID=A0A0A9ZDH5_LYGHE